MYKLTDRRFAAAESIFERHLIHIQAGHHIDAGAFERELRKCWNIGYQELKDIIIQLMVNERYTLVAASYMEHSGNSPGVVFEFQAPLAKLYGVARYESPD